VTSVTWLGHSTTVVEIDGVRFLTDPLLRRRVAHLRRDRSVDLDALGSIDALLVSHTHYDHLDFASLARLDRSMTAIAPLGAGSMLRRRGFTDVVEAIAGDAVHVGPIVVDVVHAEHGEVRRVLGIKTPALGFVLRGSRSVYFAGDTDLFPAMSDLAPLDVAVLPIAGWGSRIPAGHLDPRRAAYALQLLRPSYAVPVHWGTFRTPFGPAPNDRPAQEFAALAAEFAPHVDVRVLGLGEMLELSTLPTLQAPVHRR
jgi:L-ascorbate metabolism protein UlaG (beta-lactamase superfamily)